MGEDARGIEGVGAYGWGAMQQWGATNDLTDRPFSDMKAQGNHQLLSKVSRQAYNVSMSKMLGVASSMTQHGLLAVTTPHASAPSLNKYALGGASRHDKKVGHLSGSAGTAENGTTRFSSGCKYPWRRTLYSSDSRTATRSSSRAGSRPKIYQTHPLSSV